MQHFHRRFLFGQVRFELREATDVAGDDHVRARGDDGARFLLTERRGDFRLIQIVGAGAAAAEVGVGQLKSSTPGIARSSSRGSRRTPCAFARWQAS